MPELANLDVARIFRDYADLLDVTAANPFRIRAYRQAAGLVEALPCDVARLSPSQLDALPGVGSDLAGKIAEARNAGDLADQRALAAALDPGLPQLLTLRGLGPARVRRLHALGIESPAELARALAGGGLATEPAFPAALKQRLAAELAARGAQALRWPRGVAAPVAEHLCAQLARLPGVRRAAVAGSLRRGRPTVGDIDLVATVDGAGVPQRFANLPEVQEILACGDAGTSVLLRNGMQVDLRVAPPESFGALLLHSTGSKAHNISLRTRARRLGLKLNEYGLFAGRRRLAGRTERELYHALGLRWRKPERREAPAPMLPRLEPGQGAPSPPDASFA